MNNPHRNARTTVQGRALMVACRAEGRPVAQIAQELGVSARTVWKWLRRHRIGGAAALANRSSASAAPDAARAWIDLACRLRRDCRLTAAGIAAKLRLPRSTVARWLRRAGLGRLSSLEPKEPPRRYQRDRPGELIHLDVKQLGRFDRPGHRSTGDRRKGRNRGAGRDFVHVAIDDAPRLAHVEVLPDQRRGTTTGFLVRALRWFRARGVRAERIMTDTGSPCVSKLFAKTMRLRGLRHIRTRPYTPKANGKAERFIQTLLRDWAYVLPYRSSDARARDLPRWIDWCNQRRPHSAIGSQPPLVALNNLMRPHT